ncbi:uncharacterized protein LOC121740615 [Aricia agestis]|uniref:uncharacterized protein LOC121740615 n=1 Tax=Aricia agestis TaxID=91739 RepID=UPI001C20AEB5|nr:uncharacterized protein LOC121740615 [Aricia agestis]
MNLLILLLLALGSSDSYSIETKNPKIEDSVLLQKLHHLQKRSEPEIVQIPTWSEMLADVIVNRIKIFSFHKSDEQNAAAEYVGEAETQPGIIKRIVSEVLNVFKTYIYDPWYRIYNNNAEVENLQDPVELTGDKDPNEEVEVLEPNPNKDVEIIEPKYHGKLCNNNCTEPRASRCPAGQEMDEKGDCVDPKASKFIFNIPYHCPLGYRRDMFGICRLTI